MKLWSQLSSSGKYWGQIWCKWISWDSRRTWKGLNVKKWTWRRERQNARRYFSNGMQYEFLIFILVWCKITKSWYFYNGSEDVCFSLIVLVSVILRYAIDYVLLFLMLFHVIARSFRIILKHNYFSLNFLSLVPKTRYCFSFTSSCIPLEYLKFLLCRRSKIGSPRVNCRGAYKWV